MEMRDRPVRSPVLALERLCQLRLGLGEILDDVRDLGDKLREGERAEAADIPFGDSLRRKVRVAHALGSAISQPACEDHDVTKREQLTDFRMGTNGIRPTRMPGGSGERTWGRTPDLSHAMSRKFKRPGAC